MKRSIIYILILILCTAGWAQRFITDSTYVRFYSEAPVENIEALNYEGTSVIDLANGNVVYSIPIKGFQFDKSLMQEHFNENYLESDKYPTATFKGNISDWTDTEGKRTVTATGDMKIHGVTKSIEVEGDIIRHQDKVTVQAKFPITVADYKIKIPKAVFYNIAEVVDVTVYFEYKPYESN